jgi:hypothetical protein
MGHLTIIEQPTHHSAGLHLLQPFQALAQDVTVPVLHESDVDMMSYCRPVEIVHV